MSGQVPGLSSGENNGSGTIARLAEVFADEDAARMRELDALIRRGHGAWDPRLIPREELLEVAPRSVAALDDERNEAMGMCAGGCERAVQLGRRYANGCTPGRCKGAAEETFDRAWAERSAARAEPPHEVVEKQAVPEVVHQEEPVNTVVPKATGPAAAEPPEVVHQHQEEDPMGQKCVSCKKPVRRGHDGEVKEKCQDCRKASGEFVDPRRAEPKKSAAPAPAPKKRVASPFYGLTVRELVEQRDQIDAELRARAERLEEEREQLREALGMDRGRAEQPKTDR